MKKFFRPLIILACLAIFSTAAIAAFSEAQDQVEKLVRKVLAETNCTVSDVKFNSSGTLILTGFATNIEAAGGKTRITIEELGINFPVSFLPVLVDQEKIPEAGVLEVANSVEIKNLVETTKIKVSEEEVNSTSKTSSMLLKGLRIADASLVRKFFFGQPADEDLVSFFYALEIDSIFCKDISGQAPDTKIAYKVADYKIQGIKNGKCEAASSSGYQFVVEDFVISLDSCSARGMQLPPEGIMRNLVAMATKKGDPKEELVKIFADPSPLLQEMRYDQIEVKENGSKIGSLDSIVYLAGDNWMRRLAVNGLIIDATRLKDLGNVGAFVAGLDKCRLDALFLQKGEDNNLKLLTSLKSPEMGDISLNGTFVGDIGKAIVEMARNPVAGLGYKFKDIKLEIEDRSLLARTLTALDIKPEMAPVMVEGILMKAFENPSAETSKLVQAIRDFANRPGTLKIFTIPDMEMVAAGFIALAANPGAVLSAMASQGNQTLGDQMRALPVTSTPDTGKQIGKQPQ